MMVRDFKKALENSADSVFRAAQWLQREKNVTVRISPTTYTGHLDKGDIIAYVERIVEVKEKPDYKFTCKEDFPFDTIMVSNVESADRHVVHMWIIVSGNGTHAAVILGRHKEHFIKSNVWCPNTEKHEQKYMCPVEYVEFVKL